MTVATARRARAVHEVLVVLILLTGLLGLFLPCVRCWRETAGRAACRDNLRRLAAACFQAENVHGRLPAGFGGRRPGGSDADRGTGLLVELLPHLGRADLATCLPPAGVWYSWPSDAPPAYAVAATRVAPFECPSAAGPRAGCAVLAASFGHDEAGATAVARVVENYARAEAYRPLAVGNYAGVGGAGRGPHPLAGKYEGVFAGRTGVALAEVAAGDGLAATLLLGETCGQREGVGGPAGRPNDECEATWVGVGALPTVYGLGQGLEADWRQFASCHGGVVQFALCDGSVRGVRVGRTGDGPLNGAPWAAFDSGSLDWRVLQALAGYRDGTSFEAAAFGD